MNSEEQSSIVVINSVMFAGRRLDVFTFSDGRESTPLKPINDLFGLSWRKQLAKFERRPIWSADLGICTYQVVQADGKTRDQICIEVDGVEPFLASLNSDLIRSNGNEAGADFLDERRREWKKVMSDYRRFGVAYNANHRNGRAMLQRQMTSLISARNRAKHPEDSALLCQEIAKVAAELGNTYVSALPTSQQLPLLPIGGRQ